MEKTDVNANFQMDKQLIALESKGNYFFAVSDMIRREHDLVFNRGKGELIVISEASPKMKRIFKSNCDPIKNGARVFQPCKTDTLNANMPFVSSNRLSCAICLDPTKIKHLESESGEFNGYVDITVPKVTNYKMVNTKKGFYVERKHGYASKAKIEVSQKPRFIGVQLERPNKIRITKTGKIKFKRF